MTSISPATKWMTANNHFWAETTYLHVITLEKVLENHSTFHIERSNQTSRLTKPSKEKSTRERLLFMHWRRPSSILAILRDRWRLQLSFSGHLTVFYRRLVDPQHPRHHLWLLLRPHHLCQLILTKINFCTKIFLFLVTVMCFWVFCQWMYNTMI